MDMNIGIDGNHDQTKKGPGAAKFYYYHYSYFYYDVCAAFAASVVAVGILYLPLLLFYFTAYYSLFLSLFFLFSLLVFPMLLSHRFFFLAFRVSLNGVSSLLLGRESVSRRL